MLINTNELKLLESFEDLNIKETLLRGIYSYGFEKPSRIQSYAVPYMLTGVDLIAQSQSGTGKTGAFTIGTLQLIDEKCKYPQAILICNTHELASQIHLVISELGKYMGVEVGLLIGGVPVTKNIQESKICQILVGTPGRICDIMARGVFDLNKLKLLVIDEADELLRKEFLEQTKNIITKLPEDIQSCIFSATMPDETLDITQNFMRDPVQILVEREKLSLDLISQFCVDAVYDGNKLEILEDLYNKLSINQCIIYVNSVDRADNLQKALTNNKHVVEVIHSKLDSKTRTNIMAKFRRSEFRVLISTDLICRGIDVQHINYVINYDIPYNIESYLHRIGRSGRFGKKGVAINFITKKDKYQLKNIESHYKIKIDDLPDPSSVNKMV